MVIVIATAQCSGHGDDALGFGHPSPLRRAALVSITDLKESAELGLRLGPGGFHNRGLRA